MTTEAQKRAKAKYDASNVTRKMLRFYPKDADLLEWLEQQPSQNRYVLDLIRKDKEARR